MCDIFDREIVSKHFIQLRIRNKGRPISPDKQCPMRLVFVFRVHFLASEMTYDTSCNANI
jgi:hypothetical protein